MESNGWVMWNMGTFNDPCLAVSQSKRVSERSRASDLPGRLEKIHGGRAWLKHAYLQAKRGQGPVQAHENESWDRESWINSSLSIRLSICSVIQGRTPFWSCGHASWICSLCRSFNRTGYNLSSDFWSQLPLDKLVGQQDSQEKNHPRMDHACFWGPPMKWYHLQHKVIQETSCFIDIIYSRYRFIKPAMEWTWVNQAAFFGELW